MTPVFQHVEITDHMSTVKPLATKVKSDCKQSIYVVPNSMYDVGPTLILAVFVYRTNNHDTKSNYN